MAATTTFLLITWKGPFHGGFFWALGSFSNSSLRDALGLVIAGSIYLFLFLLLHRSLDVLLLGEEEALSLGLKVGKFRLFLLIASALSVSLVSSKFGIIGFVGLIAPHMSRLISGSLHNTLLPVAFLLGGSLLVVSDTFARTAFAPVEIPVGVITVMLGGPFFLYLLRRRV
ncbi:MAG: Hemin transport system permease protein HmuU [candidate division WS2 bacterium]|nr:Hemin transport system permease protein HmuU [Candidatus Psychracetigena formicireducens]